MQPDPAAVGHTGLQPADEEFDELLIGAVSPSAYLGWACFEVRDDS